MSWTTLDPIVPAQKAQVSAALMSFRGGEVRLAILCRSIIWHDLKNPKTVGVALGSGINEGKIRITPGGKFKPTEFAKGGARITIKRPGLLPNDTRNAKACEYEIEKGSDGLAIVITLPDWPAPPPMSVAAPVKAEPPARPSFGAKPAFTVSDASRSLMGDPPPGRSALDQKKAGR